MNTDSLTFAERSNMILDEVRQTLSQVDEAQLQTAAAILTGAERIFFHGAGRSGLALKMAAMRMMHLGLTVYVVGEVVTPAIREGDLLVTASGSGTTAGVIHAAQIAKKSGARILVITAAPESALAMLATAVITIPAATKQGTDRTASQQYAGALFEQSVLLLMDTLFQFLWQKSGATPAELWPRHANLE